jgi:sugar-phosphatase
MDGTLIDSTAAVERSWLAWAKEEGIHPDDFLRAGHGQPAAKLVASVVPPERVAESLQRLTALEEGDTDGIEILPGVQAMLDALPEGRWAIVTSSTKNLAYIRLAAAGVQPPSTVVTFDDVSRGKPDPEPFLQGARALGVDPARCLVVEDAVAGLIAGRRAGCTTLAVAGTHETSQLAAHADAVVDSFDDLAFVHRNGALSLVVHKTAGT